MCPVKKSKIGAGLEDVLLFENPLVNCYKTNWEITRYFDWAIFNSFLFVYQRVPIIVGFHVGKSSIDQPVGIWNIYLNIYCFQRRIFHRPISQLLRAFSHSNNHHLAPKVPMVEAPLLKSVNPAKTCHFCGAFGCLGFCWKMTPAWCRTSGENLNLSSWKQHVWV